MLTLKSLLLPVTARLELLMCLRSAFASGSLPSMEHQRTYNGPETEEVESSRKAQQAKTSSLSYQSFTMRKTRLREYIIWKVN